MKKLSTIYGETLLVDDEDYEKAKQYRWTIKSSKGKRQVVTYSQRKGSPYEEASYKKLILGLVSKMTLFKNDNPLDLRKENIIVFDTKSEFMSALAIRYRNKLSNPKPKKGINAQTEYIGVKLETRDRLHPWYAHIRYKKKRYYIGSFTKDEYAAYAYDKRALELYGADVMRNFPHLTLREITEKFEKIKEEDAIFFYDNNSKNKQGRILEKITKTSKYVGVCMPKSKNKWKAVIAYRKTSYNLGYFSTEEDAARAYDEKAIELYGENARLNFPPRIIPKNPEK